MEIPTLKLPPPHDKLEARRRYELGLLDPDGFAATYFKTLKRAEEEARTGYSYTTYEGEDDWRYPEAKEKEQRRAQAEALCKRVNEEYDKIRQKVDQKMQEYLLSHDGKIDLWPDCSGFSVLSSAGYKFAFHYFGSKFYCDTYSVDPPRIYRDPSLTYHNEYHTALESGSHHYSSAGHKSSELRKTMLYREEKAKTLRKYHSVGVIGAAFLIFVIASLLANLFLGIEGPVAGFLMVLSDFVGANVDDPYPGVRMFFLVISAFGLYCLVGNYIDCRRLAKQLPEAKRAYEEYNNGVYEQERQMEEETNIEKDAARNRDIALATEWHSAWFEWAKRVGDTPEDL